MVNIFPGSWLAKIEAKLMTVDVESQFDDSRHEALLYSWGGHFMLRRLITLNNSSYLVANTVLNALKELRPPDNECSCG